MYNEKYNPQLSFLVCFFHYVYQLIISLEPIVCRPIMRYGCLWSGCFRSLLSCVESEVITNEMKKLPSAMGNINT